MTLEMRIELYLRDAGISATRLGREALNDSRFVSDLRKGRWVSERTAQRVHDWLDRQGAER
jgi:hypothetical protein